MQYRLVTENRNSPRYAGELLLSYNNLGLLLNQTNRRDEAREMYEAAIALGQQQLTTGDKLMSAQCPGGQLQQPGLSAKPRRSGHGPHILSCGAALHEQLAEESPLVLSYQAELALTYNNLGALENQLERADEAEAYYERAIRLQADLVDKAPFVTSFQQDLAVTCNNLGFFYERHDRSVDAVEVFTQARDIFLRLTDQNPGIPSYSSGLGGVYNNLGMAHEKADQLAAADEAYQQAIVYQRAALDAAPEIFHFRDYLSRHYFNRGRVLRVLDRHDEAAQQALLRKALWPGQPERLYHIACELSLAAEGQADVARQQSLQQASDTLLEALDLELDELEPLIHNPDLNALRSDPHWKKIEERLTPVETSRP